MPILVDTNLVVDYLRDRPEAVAYLDGIIDQPAVSAITVAELYQGVREGGERSRLAALLSSWRIVPLTGPLAERAGLLARQYRPSHGTGIADAVVAATALDGGFTLATRNLRHFPMVDDLDVPY